MKPGLRPLRPSWRPLRPSGGGGRTYVRTGQNPPILKDIAPFGAAAQKEKERKTSQDVKKVITINAGEKEGERELLNQMPTLTSEASGMSNSLIALDWIVLLVCNFFPLVAN